MSTHYTVQVGTARTVPVKMVRINAVYCVLKMQTFRYYTVSVRAARAKLGKSATLNA